MPLTGLPDFCSFIGLQRYCNCEWYSQTCSGDVWLTCWTLWPHQDERGRLWDGTDLPGAPSSGFFRHWSDLGWKYFSYCCHFGNNCSITKKRCFFLWSPFSMGASYLSALLQWKGDLLQHKTYRKREGEKTCSSLHHSFTPHSFCVFYIYLK